MHRTAAPGITQSIRPEAMSARGRSIGMPGSAAKAVACEAVPPPPRRGLSDMFRRFEGLKPLPAKSYECRQRFRPLLTPQRSRTASLTGFELPVSPGIAYRITACRSRSNCLRAMSAHWPELSSLRYAFQ